jgi:hypothetical protein
MANEQQSDWIEWSGGECPVPGGTRVDVKFRDGTVARRQFAKTWSIGSADWWKHEFDEGHDNDIVAYSPVQP